MVHIMAAATVFLLSFVLFTFLEWQETWQETRTLAPIEYC